MASLRPSPRLGAHASSDSPLRSPPLVALSPPMSSMSPRVALDVPTYVPLFALSTGAVAPSSSAVPVGARRRRPRRARRRPATSCTSSTATSRTSSMRLDLASDRLPDEDDARWLRPVQVPVVAQGSGQQRVAVAVDLEDGADDAAHGLHLVSHFDPRPLRLPGSLRLSLLGPDEEEVPEHADGEQRQQGQATSWNWIWRWRRPRSGASAGVGVMERSLDRNRLRSATLVPWSTSLWQCRAGWISAGFLRFPAATYCRTLCVLRGTPPTCRVATASTSETPEAGSLPRLTRSATRCGRRRRPGFTVRRIDSPVSRRRPSARTASATGRERLTGAPSTGTTLASRRD